jgi:hypothetical protein
MRPDPSRFAVGDEWAYRLRDDSSSERVRILAVTAKKNSARLDVVFLDDPDAREETVPGTRLRVPWREVESYDALMANWRRIADVELDHTERACAEEVFLLLIASDIAEVLWQPVECVTTVRDRIALEKIIQVSLDEILCRVEWFDHDDQTLISPAGTLLIAEAACRTHSTAVLDSVIEQEKQSRHKCKHGSESFSARTNEKVPTSPEWEYECYRRWDRPRHELLRQWCGYRAVTFHERALAAEAENQRLDVLVAEMIQELERVGEKVLAVRFAEEHERDRITPQRARPIVDRPLHPSEIPVREIRVRRRWG